MSGQTQSEIVNPSKRLGRGCLIWLGRIVGSLVGLLLVGAVYESLAEAADAKAYPPPGQLVDVGGYRLHINCTGSGSPTVVIIAGLGDWSTSWAGSVQPEVAKTARICTYDRAGLGWSDEGLLPRDAAGAARDLHTLLQNANIPGPYILVGHSLGGLIARVFANDHPSEVAGVVLVDSMSPDQIPDQTDEALAQSGSRSHPFSMEALLARFGIARLIVKLPGTAPAVPPEMGAYYPLYIRPQTFQTTADEFQGVPISGVQAAAVKSFGGLPLIVLTAKLNVDRNWQELQTGLLQLSTNSRQLFAESGHNIQGDAPEAVVEAILQMIRQVREAE